MVTNKKKAVFDFQTSKPVAAGSSVPALWPCNNGLIYCKLESERHVGTCFVLGLLLALEYANTWRCIVSDAL